MFTGKWKYVGKNLIQIIKAILQLGLVLKKENQKEKTAVTSWSP